MKRILLTMMMMGYAFMLRAQAPALNQLYWSKGSLTLENEKMLEGFTSYYPNLDVVFFKYKDTHQIEIYHISKVAALQFFDNGMRENRHFVKLNKPQRQEQVLFEVIAMTGFYVLRIPSAASYQYEEKSRQIMDKKDHHIQGQYWLALQTGQGLSILPRNHANKIAAFIKTEKLDCYDQQAQQMICEFYQKKMGDKHIALSAERL